MGEERIKKKSCIKTKNFLYCLLVTCILIAAFTFAVSQGSASISWSEIWGIVTNKIVPGSHEITWSKGREAIIWEIRFPRALLAFLVGSGLSVVGASLQAVTRNPLADPHLLGISSGGAFGAILALLHTGLFWGLVTVPFMAFLGALLATAAVLFVARLTKATSADRLVLSGVAVSFIIMALANLLIYLGDPRAAHTVVFWMLGGLGLAQWAHLIYPLSIFFICFLWLWWRSRLLNAMAIGDETASTLGIAVARFRLEIFIVGALITGVMVAFSGLIGFVGLMVPHITRMITKNDYCRILPVATLIGGIFLLLADMVARTIMAPEELPVGVITGLLGGIFFIWLLRYKL